MAKEEALLSEIARKLRKLDCICEGVNSTGNIIVKNYQPLDCNGDPVGSPIDVMPTISVAKQDVALCNYQQLADAINGGGSNLYNIPNLSQIPIATTVNLSDYGVTAATLHSVSITVLTGTLEINGNLGGSSQAATGIPAGTTVGWEASTVFGSGDITFTTDGTGTVLLTTISQV